MAANLNDTTPAASGGRVNVLWAKDVLGNVSASVATGAGVLFADDETPSGTVNSSNTVFTLAHTPNPAASLQFFINGTLQIAGTDYTLATATITTITALPPTTGDILTAWYRY